jgi:hypothetical protein
VAGDGGIARDEGFVWVLVPLIADAIAGDLDIRAGVAHLVNFQHVMYIENKLFAYRSVSHIALALRELLQALGLVAHSALDLDDLMAAGALLAFGKVGVADVILDLVAVVGELLD